MVGVSPLKPRCREDSYQFFGTSQKAPCMLSVILEHWLNGCKQTLNLVMTQPIIWPYSTIRIAWLMILAKRQAISRSVTSCAGMTAFMVVVAQTKVGFLTGGRGQKFRSLPEEERHTQEEEIYARATVALTRARKMCVIFCPLDMKGLIAAATVMGSLMHGAGHCWHGTINMHLRDPR